MLTLKILTRISRRLRGDVDMILGFFFPRPAIDVYANIYECISPMNADTHILSL